MNSTRDQSDSRRSGGRPAVLALLVAAALAGGAPGAARAAGLGRLTVDSALGQPLQARVEITSLSRDQLDSLSARLAPVDAFRQAGIEPHPALSSLRFTIEHARDGRAYVHITSGRPINEPFVDLLVELNWATGRFIREYTFLLDPPALADAVRPGDGNAPGSPLPLPGVAPAPNAAFTAGPRGSPAGATSVVRAGNASGSVPARAPVGSDGAAGATGPEAGDPARARVAVKRGDSLATIAARVKPAGIAVEQAAVAIYEANRAAFSGNIHRLRAGSSLDIPARPAMEAVAVAEARRMMRAQAAELETPPAPAAADERSGDTAAGRTIARVGESAGPGPAGAPTGEAAAPGTPIAEAPAASAAPAEVPPPDTAPAQTSPAPAAPAQGEALRRHEERIERLEKQLAGLQSLVEQKNRQLAALEERFEAVRVGLPQVARGVPAAGRAAAPGAAIVPPVGPPSDAGSARLVPVVQSGFGPAVLGERLSAPALGALALALAGYGWYALRRRSSKARDDASGQTAPSTGAHAEAAGSQRAAQALATQDTRTGLERAIDGRFELPSLDLDPLPGEHEAVPRGGRTGASTR